MFTADCSIYKLFMFVVSTLLAILFGAFMALLLIWHLDGKKEATDFLRYLLGREKKE